MLSQEVDQLKKMLKAGANWEVISQVMSYISDKAAQVRAQLHPTVLPCCRNSCWRRC